MADGVSARDDARLLDLAAEVLGSSDPDTLWTRAGAEIMDALPGTAVLCKDDEWTEGSGRVFAWPVPRQPTPDQLACIRRGHPFTGGGAAIPGDRLLVASEIAGEGAWRDSETYDVTRALFGTSDVIGLRLDEGSPGPVRGLLVHCTGRGGTPRERAYLARMRPLLCGMDRHAALLRRCAPAPAARAEGDGRGLTAREITVLALLAEALPAHAIGRQLGISVRTVHKHVENIYRKLRTRDRLETVLLAQEAGLLPAPRGGRKQ
ncbi:helix-turn-helix transcriptional regulator [Streptomyces fuscigenes]|uniref:helix-turn-helix transcriptional regulator n=1 Tax=Streptomyces fuscigenes TaxID=1528880 RepID=UPI001F2A435F|nr:LuxR C-terminal-related transcriptional regulator [Streptomyces fuscigenes]MCF3965478.1 LuxR C-terminal-related transcriptional regulator [Streptomyces fuscigenes]